MEHGIHCLPCFFTNDVLDLLPWQLPRHINFSDVIGIPFCHGNTLSTTVGYSLVAMVTELCCHLTYELRRAGHKVYAVLLKL